VLGDRRIPGAIGVVTVALAFQPNVIQAKLRQKVNCDRMLFLYLVQTP
jgi:hypothetical protein